MDTSNGNQAPSSTRGPMTRGQVTANYYVPTLEEKAVIDRANTQFIATYFTGIALGVTGGALLVRHRKVPWNSVPSIFLMAGCGLAGELLGRKSGEAKARETLSRGLPLNSKLRALLEENTRGLSIPKAPALPPTSEHHDFGVEGSVPPSMSPVASRNPSPLNSHQTPYSDDEEYVTSTSSTNSTNSWEKIRRENVTSNTAWDKIRQGRSVNPPPQSTDDSDLYDDDSFSSSNSTTSDPIIPRTRVEQLKAERLGQVRRNSYGDLDSPVVARVGGRGLLGPYGDTVAATPAGNVDLPRTREDLEESLGRGNVRRNAYGDMTD